jgi:hypothetical protein
MTKVPVRSLITCAILISLYIYASLETSMLMILSCHSPEPATSVEVVRNSPLD